MNAQEAKVYLETVVDRLEVADTFMEHRKFTDAASELSKAMDAIHAVIKYCDERSQS